jgi:hypothetical protein
LKALTSISNLFGMINIATRNKIRRITDHLAKKKMENKK